jgi:ankyrin repeat protein
LDPDRNILKKPLSHPQFTSPDQRVASVILDSHANTQCRLDIMTAAIFGDAKPKCFFPTSEKEQELLDQVQKGDIPAVEKLLAEGASPNASNNVGMTPLLLAIKSGNEKLIQIFINNPAIDYSIKNDGLENPFIAAVRLGREDLVQLMHERSPKEKISGLVNSFNYTGFTPLMFAVKEDRTDLINILLANGADPLIKNFKNISAREMAKDKGIEI